MCCGMGRASSGWVSSLPVLREHNTESNTRVLDCFQPVCRQRFTDLCTEAATEHGENAPSDPLEKLVTISCPTLAHFIALLCRPTQSSLPTDAALIVVDSLSALINHAFPRIPAPKAATKANNKGMATQ